MRSKETSRCGRKRVMKVNESDADSVKVMRNSRGSQCVNRMRPRDDNARNAMRVTRIRMWICMDMRRMERVEYTRDGKIKEEWDKGRTKREIEERKREPGVGAFSRGKAIERGGKTIHVRSENVTEIGRNGARGNESDCLRFSACASVLWEKERTREREHKILEKRERKGKSWGNTRE